MTKILRKRPVEADVYELAKERVRHAFRLADRVAVGFSGGKDSTAVLNVTLEVAAELRESRPELPPVLVHFYDEEVIIPLTADYVARIAARPDVALRWFCAPIKHRNGCSRKSPWWYPWDPRCPELWVREKPACALEVPGGFGKQIPELNALIYPPAEFGQVAVLTGIRTQESFQRYISVALKEEDNYISREEFGPNLLHVRPIYDWEVEDVWLGPAIRGWDYNRAYDTMEAFGLTWTQQRVAPPYGEQPMQQLRMYAACFPELWDKMLQRVPGAATAARYARTELYGYRMEDLPPGVTSWRSMVDRFLARQSPEVRLQTGRRILAEIKRHKLLTTDAIPETEGHPSSGLHWRFLATLASRGDTKGRRMACVNLQNNPAWVEEKKKRDKAVGKAVTGKASRRRRGADNPTGPGGAAG